MADNTSLPAVRKGACLCRKIQYELTGEPFLFAICHCNNCRAATGSAFMSNFFFKQSQIKITDEENFLRTYLDSDKSSNPDTPLTRQFCGNCGSTMFVYGTNSKTSGSIIVSSGTIEDPMRGWVPQHEFFCRRRRDWVTPFASTVKHE